MEQWQVQWRKKQWEERTWRGYDWKRKGGREGERDGESKGLQWVESCLLRLCLKWPPIPVGLPYTSWKHTLQRERERERGREGGREGEREIYSVELKTQDYKTGLQNRTDRFLWHPEPALGQRNWSCCHGRREPVVPDWPPGRARSYTADLTVYSTPRQPWGGEEDL